MTKTCLGSDPESEVCLRKAGSYPKLKPRAPGCSFPFFSAAKTAVTLSYSFHPLRAKTIYTIPAAKGREVCDVLHPTSLFLRDLRAVCSGWRSCWLSRQLARCLRSHWRSCLCSFLVRTREGPPRLRQTGSCKPAKSGCGLRAANLFGRFLDCHGSSRLPGRSSEVDLSSRRPARGTNDTTSAQPRTWNLETLEPLERWNLGTFP